MSSPQIPPTLAAAWPKSRYHAQRLLEALDDLDDAGGLKALAPHWSPGMTRRALAELQEARRVLGDQVEVLRDRLRHERIPARRRA